MKTIYSKFNRNRKPEYQTITKICIEPETNNKFIVKIPLLKESIPHVLSLNKNYELLKQNFENINFTAAKSIDNQIILDYIDGVSLQQLLLQSAVDKDKDRMKEIINDYLNFINSLKSDYFENFVSNEEFRKIFGCNPELNNIKCFSVSNIDMILENIIIDNNKYYVIDYEWVFDFAIPVNFVLYRAFKNLSALFPYYINSLISFNKLISMAGITEQEIKYYQVMEDNFLTHVYGKNQPHIISDKYRKEAKSLNSLLVNQGHKSKGNILKPLIRKLLRQS